MAIGNQATQEIDQEVDGTALARMFDLRNVFELGDNGFCNCRLAQQEFVHQRHQSILHVRTDRCDELDIEGTQEFFSQFFGEGALVPKQFSKESAH